VARPTGLGRGLDALIPSRDSRKASRGGSSNDGGSGDGGSIDGVGLRNLPVKSISKNPNQPRTHFDDEALTELSNSIKAVGLLQPVLVRPKPGKAGEFELIAGERRLRASQRAGLTVIPALVRDTDEVTSVEQALVENLHRQDLKPLEEAAAYKQLLDDFNMTHEKVAEKVGKTRSAITNSLRLLTLSPAIQQLLADGRLSGGHARALLSMTDRTSQEELARRCVKDGLSVRAIEEEVRLATGRTTTTKKSNGTGANVSTTTSTTTSALKNRSALGNMPAPGIAELEKLLAEFLATTVSVSTNKGKGKIIIDFADLADFERIYRAMTEGNSQQQ